jgi:hypothetical protein
MMSWMSRLCPGSEIRPTLSPDNVMKCKCMIDALLLLPQVGKARQGGKVHSFLVLRSEHNSFGGVRGGFACISKIPES